MAARVVLVHGLWMNALALYPLQARLAKRGFSVERFGYASVRGAPDRNARRLGRLIAGLAGPLHLVGHSMGGVLILQALREFPDARVRRAVLLGAPVAGSVAGRGLARAGAGRWLLGRSQPLWAEGRTPDAPPGVELGIIAGTLPIGLGRVLAPLPGPNDGVVAVEETRVNGAADTLLMRVTHSGMIVSAAVARQVCAFLEAGRFARD